MKSVTVVIHLDFFLLLSLVSTPVTMADEEEEPEDDTYCQPGLCVCVCVCVFV